MNDSISIQQRLRENNPFASLSSPFPWENTNPDIAQLNRDVSEEIEQLIRQKRREPSVPLAGLVLGDIGYGKTHMMMRILRRLRNNEQPALFAAVKAFRNPKGVMQHMLSEIFINLKLTHSGGRSQFDMLAEGIEAAYRERRTQDGFDDISAIDTRKYLARDIPRLDRNFLRCILLYLGTDDEFVRADIIEWLCDRLDDETSKELGLPFKDTASMTEEGREELAEKTLISLGLVMGYAKMPMIVCFDQLDNMKSPDLIGAWGEIVALLMNDLSGVLPLCFLKAATWEDNFRPVLDAAVVQRIEHVKMYMKGCSSAQAQQLLHEKIASVFKEGAEEIYQWLITRVNNVLREGLSPRKVIQLASSAIEENQNPTDIIQRAYNEESDKIRSVPLAWPPNAEHLTLTLEEWLSSLDGFSLQQPSGRYIRVQGVRGDRKFAFIIVIPKSHVTATNAVKEGLRFMNEYPGSFCCYVLEEKVHKKTWKKFAETLNEFERAGGFTVRLGKDSRISWYALTALINRIDNGDINIYSASSSRAASRNDIAGFLRTLRLIDTEALEFSPVSVKYAHPSKKQKAEVYFDDKLFSETLSGIITSSPMQLLAVDKAAELLSQRGIKAGRNEIIAFVKNNRESFRTFSSKNDTLITIAEKKK